MAQPELTFALLDTKIDQLPVHVSMSTPMSKLERCSLAIGLTAGGVGILLAKLLPGGHITLVIVCVLLVIELAGLGYAVWLQFPRRWLSFASERRDMADMLDFDLPHHEALIRWLQAYPRVRLERMERFVSYRQQRLTERLPLLTGGVDKLGMLPLLVALYLQFKDAHWPPHPSWLEIGLIFLLGFGYWLSLLQINVRLRVPLYQIVLKKALDSYRYQRR